MAEWRYSKRRLAELEARLAAIDEEQAALDISGPRAEAPRFANRADERRYDDLTREWARVLDERDRCRMALWRRHRNRAHTAR